MSINRASAHAPASSPKPSRSCCGWAAIEAAQQCWRPTNPRDQLYLDVKARSGGQGNPAKTAVARKVLIAAWHVLSLGEPFKISRPRGSASPVPAGTSFALAD